MGRDEELPEVRNVWFGMLKQNRIILLTSLAVLVLLLLGENLFLSSFQQCVYGDPTNGGTNYSDYDSRVVLAFFKNQIPCTVRGLDTHAGLLAAISGFIVALFTYTLWRSTDKLWKAGEKQFKLARDEFNATHRPMLRVRSFHIDTGSDGNPVIRFTIIYTGQSSGTVIQLRVNTGLLADRIRPVPPFYGDPIPIQIITVPAGTFWEVTTPSFAPDWFTSGGRQHGMEMHVVGRILYRDEGNRIYARGFGRRWNNDLMRFDPVDDPEYEYDE